MRKPARISAVGGTPPTTCKRCNRGDGGFSTRGGRNYSAICNRCGNAKKLAASAERKRVREHRKAYRVWQSIMSEKNAGPCKYIACMSSDCSCEGRGSCGEG